MRLATNESRLREQLGDENRQLPAVLTLESGLKRLAQPAKQPADARRTRPGRGGDRQAGERHDDRHGAEDQDPVTRDEERGDADEPRRQEQGANAWSPDAAEERADQPIDNEFEPAVAPDPAAPDAVEAWLHAIPLRAQLTDPTVFDAEARHWQRVRPLVEEMRLRKAPTADEVGKLRVPSWVRKRFALIVAQVVSVRPPQEWALCGRCQGTGRSRALSMPCDWCDGAGFAPMLECDAARDPAAMCEED